MLSGNGPLPAYLLPVLLIIGEEPVGGDLDSWLT
jgi:hypothetical protein